MNIFRKIFCRHPEAIPFKQGFDLTELPICTFQQGDRKLNFLLDTGSNDSIIDSSVLGQIESEKMEYEGTLFGLDGKKQSVTKCRIVLAYKEQHYEYEYIIQDMSAPFAQIKQDTGVTLHGILGSKFFHKFRYVLDFAELIAYSKQ